MAETDERVALHQLLAAAIRSCELEIARMNAAIRLLEKAKRQRIENAYDEGERWLGLATDEFIRMVDALVVLTRQNTPVRRTFG
ncbi:hypothetical protein [Paracoccus endophyticus]|uniref:hypothetical protein n=1 Tax=Paracoccus endophyticus TaxID=2233774 RepID=UPI000DD60FC7|nr:hypothetical protein [Paracoccus endophyticus]